MTGTHAALVPRSGYPTLQECTYLNQASLGLIPARSLDAMVAFLHNVAQHGNLRLSDEEEARVLDDVRAAAAELIDAPASRVAVTGGASEALGQLAAMLGSIDGSVVLVSSDFPSVTYPWLAERERRGTPIVWVDDTPDADLTEGLVRAVDGSTKAVCVSAVQYATGTSIDVPTLTARAREAGCRVILDVTQLAGARPVSMRGWSADAIVCSGYKWLSSHGGVALLALAPDLVAATPHLVGWKGARDPFAFDPKTLRLTPDARRFELSTISYASAVGLLTSIGVLQATGIQRIADHARGLASRLVEGVEPLGWLPFHRPPDPASSNHIVALRHPVADARHVQRLLSEERRIICSSRAGMLRVSIHLYNDASDVEALVNALGSIRAEGGDR